MFTDIEGFTTLMQTDEEAGLEMRNRHREVFEAAHQKFNGKVIQYFGDGTLSIFKSSREAVDCAMEMQQAFQNIPKVPLRIGIHAGEIMLVEDDILGDSVNIASRVESIGVAGSIFISAKVYDNIRNQKDIQVRSMGLFEFKNINTAKEVFAIANKGLVVPNPEALTGKTKLKDYRKEADRNFLSILKDLWERKVFLVAGGYLMVLWGLVKLMNVVISNYAISPYWVDVLLVFFISFLPSVILHSYYHNRIELSNWRQAEKITIPSNAMLSIALLVFLFGGKDLGATTRTAISQDEFGNPVEKIYVKEEFLKRLNFYPFSNQSNDSTLNWMGRGISLLLWHDIVDDDYVLVDESETHKNLGARLLKINKKKSPHF